MDTMSIKRLDEQQIADLIGGAAFRRLQNRERGGEANFKGNRFELLFGVHRVAELARNWLATGKDHVIEWQAGGVVDDYVVRHDESYSFNAYQLKNTQSVSWTNGNPSISDDFSLQYKLSEAEGYRSIGLQLICSNRDTAEALKSSVPNEISAFSTAAYFPYRDPLFPMLFEHPELWIDFAHLSKNEHPQKIEVQQVVSILIGAWETAGPKATVSEVFQWCRNTSPTIFRSERSDEEAEAQLLPELRATLQGLPDFEYKISRGFMRWVAMNRTTSGVLSFDCFSENFIGWQKHIVALHPRSFEDIEGVLK